MPRDLTPARRGATAVEAAPMPMSLPTEWHTRDGRRRLAYARSAWHPLRYLVMEFGAQPGRANVDLECVHDDFGQLVPVRQRVVTPDSDIASYMRWMPVQPEALS